MTIWYRITNDKDHDYIVRQVKPFVNSELGRALGLKYTPLMRGKWVPGYCYDSDSQYQKRYFYRRWREWKLIDFDAGHLQRCGFNKHVVIDLGATRKLFTGDILKSRIKKAVTKIKKAKVKKTVKTVLGSGWNSVFDI